MVGLRGELGNLQGVEVLHNRADGHWHVKQGQPPPEQRQEREREVKLTSFILALVCYWRGLQSFVLMKLLAGSSVNFICLFSLLNVNNWIYRSFFLSIFFSSHSFIPFPLCPVSFSKRLRMSWSSLSHPFTSLRALLKHRSSEKPTLTSLLKALHPACAIHYHLILSVFFFPVLITTENYLIGLCSSPFFSH